MFATIRWFFAPKSGGADRLLELAALTGGTGTPAVPIKHRTP